MKGMRNLFDLKMTFFYDSVDSHASSERWKMMKNLHKNK